MWRQVKRVRALGLMIVAALLGCASNAALTGPGLSAQQTVAMVRGRQFAALDRHYAAIQAGYERGSVSDEKLRAEFRNFYDSSPDLASQYESWVTEMPDSYVAHLARAIYYLADAGLPGGLPCRRIVS